MNPDRCPDEVLYVELDDETDMFGVYGACSGYCYGQFNTREDAEDLLCGQITE